MGELTVIAVKQRYSAATWKERVAECRSSGQGVMEWCAANGINRKSYYRWERRLLQEAGNELRCIPQPRQNQRFAEIPQVPCTPDAVAVIHFGEFTCELRQGITAEQISVIVQVMKSHA